MDQQLIAELKRQNRLLKGGLAIAGVGLLAMLTMAAKSPDERARFRQIDVERINIVNPDGKPAIVLANSRNLPAPIQDGKTIKSDRGQMPGLIFFNSLGDEVGGLIFDGKLDDKGRPKAGMHFSMDRFGGDQQVALSHYEGGGAMETGLNVFDRGLYKDYGALWDAYQAAAPGPEKEALKLKWQQAGGEQVKRLFVGRTRGQSSAVILADAKGRPKIMMLVTPEGKPQLNFLDDKGAIIQSLPAAQ